jgi:hypothetical protein
MTRKCEIELPPLRRAVPVNGSGRPVRKVFGRRVRYLNASTVALLVLEFKIGHGLTLRAAAERASLWFLARGVRRVSVSQATKCYANYFAHGKNLAHANAIADRYAGYVGIRVAESAGTRAPSSDDIRCACRKLNALGVKLTQEHARRLWKRYRQNVIVA